MSCVIYQADMVNKNNVAPYYISLMDNDKSIYWLGKFTLTYIKQALDWRQK